MDAIGGSSAGIIIDNRPMVASLFRGVPPERFRPGAQTCSCASARELGVPLEVINDGDVTALAGSMSLEITASWASPWAPARRPVMSNLQGHIWAG